MSPETETVRPNPSPAASSDATSLEVWVHIVPELVPLFSNTYAEPDEVPLSASYKAPTSTVSPEIETTYPNLSAAVPSGAISLEA